MTLREPFTLTVGSLFSGIGGFDLGLERAGFEIKWQVENNEYCRQVLKKHWPSIPQYGDIATIEWGTVEPVEMLCGGFPCQDLSLAGKREGINGTRSGLWSEYVRAIRALRPRYIIVENVPGLLTNQYLGRVLGDLAACGYDAEWDCIYAAQCGAPHRRDRVWIVAYPTGGQLGRIWDAIKEEGPRHRDELLGDVSRLSWQEAIAKFHGMDDGVSTWSHRNRSLGNAVIPQIPEIIGNMILEVERATL